MNRRALVAFYVLAAAAVAGFVAWRLVLDPHLELTPPPTVRLEIEHHPGSKFDQPKTVYVDYEGQQRSLEEMYSTTGLGIEIKVDFLPEDLSVIDEDSRICLDGSAGPADSAPDSASSTQSCVPAREFDLIFSGTTDPYPPEHWYAHGLTVPACCPEADPNEVCPNEDIDSLPGVCSGSFGAIWFGWSWFAQGTGQSASQKRRDFIVMDAVNSDNQMMMTISHELAHVLNVHHCEYQENKVVGDGNTLPTLTDWTLKHLVDHRVASPYYVRPGSDAAGFCELSTDHVAMHKTMDDLYIPECGPAACEDDTGATLRSGVELEVRPEKESYVPGEPFRVDVTLRPHPGVMGLQYYGEESLDPTRGLLTLWAGSPDRNQGCEAPRGVAKLSRVSLAEFDGSPEALVEAVTVEGLDAWAPLPVLSEDVCIRAVYRGFPNTDEIARSRFSRVPIRFGESPQPPAGFADFAAPDARRFLYFMGGDHLTAGRAALWNVSNLGGGPYKPYADLALGVSLAEPFRFWDKAGTANAIRRRDPEKSRAFLDRLWNPTAPAPLPRSYMLTLHYARAMVYEELGDRERAAGDSAAAFELYNVALVHRNRIASGELPRPVTMSRRDAQQRAVNALSRLNAKIAAVSPGPP